MEPQPDTLRLAVPGELSALPEAMRTVARFLKERGATPRVVYAVELVLDEYFSNVLRHAFPDGVRGRIRLQLALDESHVRIRLEDSGVAFDPSAHPLPAAPASLEDASLGGRGLALVRGFADHIDYRRIEGDAGGLNRLAISVPVH